MSLRRIALAGLPVACVLVALAFTRAPRADINDLAWMAGCWKLESAGRIIEEQWMAPRGGMMLGMGRTVRQGRTAEFEQTRIEQHGDTVIFFAQPSGQSASSFPAKTLSRQEVVFENLSHDFPQRVIYRSGRDSLHASIEGMQNGTLVRVPFPMGRVACAGNPVAGRGVGPE